jgi:Tfp pilus assembly protein PilN
MMRRLWLDYVRPDPERRRPGLAVLALGVVATLLTSIDYLAVAAERDDVRAQVEQLQRASPLPRATARTAPGAPSAARGGVEAPTADRTTATDRTVTAVPAPSAARWEALFASLEAASDDSVTLLSLHPGEKEIQISGEARDFPASVDYVQRLQAAPALANARLTRSEVVTENPRHPVRFSLVADWRGTL